MHGKKWPSRLVVAMTEMQKIVQSLGETAGMVRESGQNQRQGQKLRERMGVLSQHSLADFLSFLEEVSGREGLLMENLYSIFTGEPLRNLHSEWSRPLKSFLF